MMRKIYRNLIYAILLILGTALIVVADTTPSISLTEPLTRLLAFIVGVVDLVVAVFAVWAFEIYFDLDKSSSEEAKEQSTSTITATV